MNKHEDNESFFFFATSNNKNMEKTLFHNGKEKGKI
jgi:hypothetical protein